jgi:hypothetical protein
MSEMICDIVSILKGDNFTNSQVSFLKDYEKYRSLIGLKYLQEDV